MDPPVYSHINFRHTDGTIISGTVTKRVEYTICDIIELPIGLSTKVNFANVIQCEGRNIIYIQDNKEKHGVLNSYVKYINYTVNLDDPFFVHTTESCDVHYYTVVEQYRILKINSSF